MKQNWDVFQSLRDGRILKHWWLRFLSGYQVHVNMVIYRRYWKDLWQSHWKYESMTVHLLLSLSVRSLLTHVTQSWQYKRGMKLGSVAPCQKKTLENIYTIWSSQLEYNSKSVCKKKYIIIYYINNSEIPGFFLLLKNHIFMARSEDIYVICRLGGRPRAAFSSPRSQFFTIRTDRKPANNMFIFFFLQ